MMAKRFIIPVAVVCILLGFWGGSMLRSGGDGEKQEAAVVPLEALAVADSLTPTPIKHLTGEILAVSGNTFTFHIQSINDSTLDASFYERKVRVDPQTKIQAIVERSGADAEAEMEAFQQAMASFEKLRQTQTSATPPSVPMLYEKKTITVGELKQGQEVSILVENDVRFQKEFTAAMVEVLPTRKNP